MTEVNNTTAEVISAESKFSKKKKIIVIVIVLLLALAAFGAWFSGIVGGISKEKAKEIALKQVPGAKEDEMIISNAEFDDMQKSYEVQISHDNKLYEFQILARDGKIVEKEMQTMIPTANPAPAEGDKVVDNIGVDKAKEIAVKNVTGSTIKDVKSAQFENIDGHYCYEVEIRYDNTTYELTIDPVTGDVLGSASESSRD